MKTATRHFQQGLVVFLIVAACIRARLVGAGPQKYDGRSSESVATIGNVNGVPVYGFGDTYVYGVSPDFVKPLEIQQNNANPMMKIKPKKSWEVETNMLGATPPRLPRTAASDFQPFLGLHLIDDNPDTAWSSRSQSQPDVEPAWIRLDLPTETRVKEIVLRARKGRRNVARELQIRVSRDAWHWETVYSSESFSLPEHSDHFSVRLDSKPIKQVWIVANNFPPCEFGYCFSLSEVKVVDEIGQNVASLAKGTGVTVSSTNYGTPSSRELHEALWGTHYDLGLKWVRVAYWDSALNWHHVEKERGRYEIDLRSDAAISEAVSNGMNVILCLAYGNWLYTDQVGRIAHQETWEMPFNMAPAPTSRAMMKSTAMLEGYKNFVRFMVRHFKDRVRYYEIYNEEDAPELWDQSGSIQRDQRTSDPREYVRLVKEVIPVIKKEYADARIVLGSVSPHRLYLPDGLGTGYLKACLEEGVGRLVDVIAWHPFYGMDPEMPEYATYPAQVRRFKDLAKSYGFKGEYMATELLWRSPYPPASNQPGYVKGSGYMYGPVSEIVKAKYLARAMLMHTALGIASFWNETWADGQVPADATLFRNGFSSSPLNPQQPQAAYYVLRTLSTILENALPAELGVQFHPEIGKAQAFVLRNKAGEFLLALWTEGRSTDETQSVTSDVRLPGGKFVSAVGIDTLNGLEQALSISEEGTDTVIKGVLVRDYPIIVRLGVSR